jgi:hypothetical protein
MGFEGQNIRTREPGGRCAFTQAEGFQFQVNNDDLKKN